MTLKIANETKVIQYLFQRATASWKHIVKFFTHYFAAVFSPTALRRAYYDNTV